MRILFYFFLSLSALVFGQIPSNGYLFIKTNSENLTVIMDDTLHQPVNQVISVPAGIHQIRIPASVSAPWDQRDFVREVHILTMDTSRIEVEYPKWIQLITMPFNATVIQRKDTLGTSPLYIPLEKVPAEVTIKKAGYETIIFFILETTASPIRISLTEKKGTHISNFFPREKRTQIKPWVKMTLAGIGVTSGIVAIYYKQKADREYDKYSRTLDPRYYNRTNALDRISLLSYSITQVSLATFMFLLIRF